ncbi:MAG: NAD(FAD)-utilizing dehydrogenase [Ignavibacteriae bacterium]|nr:MAG: NAD(FAD)-utilizing dehydrogenase [Ignavibacteriota bacterium]
MNNFKHSEVIVIGGGAAGIIAAWRAASLGVDTLLIEKNNTLGRKLLISGSGKCNITHSGTVEELLKGFPKNEANFLKYSFYRFSNSDILNLLNSYGLKTFVREDGKVFPVSQRARDVLNVFMKLLRENNGKILLNSTVIDLQMHRDYFFKVITGSNQIESKCIIIATGGVSYPHTGSTGDGYLFAQKLGHNIIEIKPALAPVEVFPEFPEVWKGIALRNGLLKCYLDGNKLIEESGDVLFTHRGLSGPAILEISRYAAENIKKGNLYLYYDLFPFKSAEEFDIELTENFVNNSNKEVENVLKIYLPNRIIKHFLNRVGIEESKRCNQVSKQERKKILDLIKNMPLGKIVSIDIKSGEVTAGGVSLKEVNSRTMESKKIKGIYFCGEVLDIAGRIGGYNLQAAYSTGYVAGENAAEIIKSRLMR